MKPGRIPCLVPFCRVTGAIEKHPGCTEVLCRKHWMMVDARERNFLKTVERKLRRVLDPRKRTKLLWMQHRSWGRIRRKAIERSAGI